MESWWVTVQTHPLHTPIHYDVIESGGLTPYTHQRRECESVASTALALYSCTSEKHHCSFHCVHLQNLKEPTVHSRKRRKQSSFSARENAPGAWGHGHLVLQVLQLGHGQAQMIQQLPQKRGEKHMETPNGR